MGLVGLGRLVGLQGGHHLPVISRGEVDVEGEIRRVHICGIATGGPSSTCHKQRGRGCGGGGPHKRLRRSVGGSFDGESDRGIEGGLKGG